MIDLQDAQVGLVEDGPIGMEITITTGPGRNWANLWKPLLDSFGPVLGEDPSQPFRPADDRITSLGLHHHIGADLGHDVLVEALLARLARSLTRHALCCRGAARGAPSAWVIQTDRGERRVVAHGRAGSWVRSG